MKLLYRHLFETYCSKRKTYKKAGRGKKSNAAEALIDNEVNILYEKYLH